MSKPFTSALEQHFEIIRALRLKKKTWREIAIILSEEHGTSTSFQNCFQFFKRYSRKSAPLGFPERTRPGAHKDLAAIRAKAATQAKPEKKEDARPDFIVTEEDWKGITR